MPKLTVSQVVALFGSTPADAVKKTAKICAVGIHNIYIWRNRGAFPPKQARPLFEAAAGRLTWDQIPISGDRVELLERAEKYEQQAAELLKKAGDLRALTARPILRRRASAAAT